MHWLILMPKPTRSARKSRYFVERLEHEHLPATSHG